MPSVENVATLKIQLASETERCSKATPLKDPFGRIWPLAKPDLAAPNPPNRPEVPGFDTPDLLERPPSGGGREDRTGTWPGRHHVNALYGHFR